MFKYEITRDDNKTTITFNGDMDIDVTELIEDEMTPRLLICQNMEIDFSNVPFVDSSGIGLLITLIGMLKEKGVDVTIVNIQDDVKQIFSLLQLPEILGHGVCVDFLDGKLS